MKKIKLLKIVFNQEISNREVSFFRGAVIDKVKNEKDIVLFHNHNKQTFRYSYPLIQYKRIDGKAAFVAIQDGTDQIHKFFQQPSWRLRLGNRNYDFKVKNLSIDDVTMQVSDKSFNFIIHEWLPLSQKNNIKYKSLNSEIEQYEFLERILIGNIITFAKGIDWNIDKQIKLRIKDVSKVSSITMKEVKLKAFTLKFSCNILIPDDIGLGNNVSLGYGMVKAESKNNGR